MPTPVDTPSLFLTTTTTREAAMPNLHSLWSCTDRRNRTIPLLAFGTQPLHFRRKQLRAGHELSKLIAQWVSGESVDPEDLFDAYAGAGRPRLSGHLRELVDETLTGCADCNTPCLPEEHYNASDECICSDCSEYYITCSDCDRGVHEDNTMQVGDDGRTETVCETCYSESYFTCGRCDSSFHNEDSVSVVDRNYSVCESCSESMYTDEDGECYYSRPGSDLILPYNVTRTGPIGDMPQDRSRYHVMGFELEIELPDREDFARDLKEAISIKVAHCKSDGSLNSDTGVEVVTGYGTMHKMVPLADQIIAIARSYGATSHDNHRCGLHVGLDRRDLSDVNEAQFVGMWHNGENRTSFRPFARRNYLEGEYCSARSNKSGKAYVDEAKLNGVPSSSKFEVVNTAHTTHLEVRAFRGSLLPITVHACLAIVSLSAHYCKKNREVEELSVVPFIDWAMNLADKRVDACEKYLNKRGTSFNQIKEERVPAPALS